MAGTKAGGLKAAQKNKERYGQDFYKRVGHLGGSAPSRYPKGFAANRELAREAGAKGGRISKRGVAKTVAKVKVLEYTTIRKEMVNV